MLDQMIFVFSKKTTNRNVTVNHRHLITKRKKEQLLAEKEAEPDYSYTEKIEDVPAGETVEKKKKPVVRKTVEIATQGRPCGVKSIFSTGSYGDARSLNIARGGRYAPPRDFATFSGGIKMDYLAILSS